MSTIDEKIVQAKFDGKQFADGVRGTLDQLAALKKGLQLDGANRSFDELDKAAKRVDLSNISAGIDHIASKFNALTAIATAALAKITQQAVVKGEQFLKSFTLGPIIDGFHEYETKLGATQTILANTSRFGTKLADVNKALNDLNHYADKTIYNFGEMTKNVGLFTNAGIRIEDATSMIKGFSNAAAASGTNAEGAAHAAYQLSQALSTGTIRLMDWRSLTNVGMGNKNMQNSLIELAGAMGTLESHGVTASGVQKNFNQSLQEGWLTTKVMSKYLKIMAGDITDAQMKHLGLSTSQIKTLREQQKTAEEAATKVRTLTQLLGTLKEAIGSGWSATFEIIFGNFGKATELFTGINNALGGMINRSANARNKLLKEWAKGGGRSAFLDGLRASFEALKQVITTISSAFREIFPKKTAADLIEMSKRFQAFGESLKMGGDTLDKLKRTFAGVFAVFSIIGQVISGVVSGIKDLIVAVSGARSSSGGFLGLTAGLGDFLVGLDKMLKESGALKDFFHGIATILAVPLKLIVSIAGLIGKLFTGFDHHGASQVSDALSSVTDKMNPVMRVGERLSNFFGKLGGILSNVGGKISDIMSNLGDAISKSITPQSFDHLLAVINTALIGGIALMFKNFFKGAGNIKIDFGGGLLEGMKTTLGETTKTLKAMQTQIKADAILKIAIAIGLLAVSILLLASIDGKKLAKGMAGVSIAFAGMSVSLAALAKYIGMMGALKLPFITAAMLLMASAMLVLAVAMKILASISWNGIAKGLGSVAVMLATIGVALRAMPGGPTMALQGAGLVLIGLALNEMAVALKIFGSMNMKEIGQGLYALGGSIAIIIAAMRLLPKTMLAQAAGLAVLGLALNAIGTAMKIFGTMKWDSIARGLYAMAGSLAIIVATIRLMPKTMALQAAGLVGIAVALNIIAGAMKLLGTMSWEEIAKGIVAIGGALVVIAGGLYLMSSALPGAAALLVVSAALAIFVPVLVTLGNLNWGTIIKGLVTLALTFTILGVAGALLSELVPILLALGAAILLVGAGFALAGAGVFLFGTGVGILIATISAGLSTFAQMTKDLAMSIPLLMEAFGKGIIRIAKVLIDGTGTILKAFAGIFTGLLDIVIKYVPKIVKFFIDLIGQLLDGIVKLAPKIEKAMDAIVRMLVHVLVKDAPQLGDAAWTLLLKLINGFDKKQQELIDAGTRVLKHFITGIGKAALELVDTAAQALLTFLFGLADAIRLYQPEFAAAGMDIASAIGEGFWNGLKSMLGSKLFGKVASIFGYSGVLGAAYNVLGAASPSKEFHKLGTYVIHGFINGLVGGRDAIRATWDTMHGFLRDAIANAKDDIQTYTDKLHAAQKAHNPAQIQKFSAALARAHKELNASSDALDLMNNHMKRQHDHLTRLAKQYDDWTAKIDKANQALADAKQLRDDYKSQTTEQYSALPDIAGDTNLGDYETNLKKQVVDTQSLADVMAQLRKMGLDDQTYKEIIAKGTDALPFAEQILAGGKDAINELKQLDSQLTAEAKALGGAASTALYQAGVDSAQGFLDGLKRERAAIAAEMRHIAHILATEIRKELKIKSPSQVFDEIGQFTGKGLARGLEKSVPHIQHAARKLGNNTIESIKQSIAGMNDLISAQTDLNPTIKPVLDLSLVRKQAVGLGQALSPKMIGLDGTYLKAISASASYQANRDAISSGDISETAPGDVIYNQYNNSPKALSTAEIYRNTTNQLSRVKGALADRVA